jgi:hypothetical protein
VKLSVPGALIVEKVRHSDSGSTRSVYACGPVRQTIEEAEADLRAMALGCRAEALLANEEPPVSLRREMGAFPGVASAAWSFFREQFQGWPPTEPEYFLLSLKHAPVGNSALWWGPNSGGYTCVLDRAGRYSEAEAMQIERASRGDVKAFRRSEVEPLARRRVDYGTALLSLQAVSPAADCCCGDFCEGTCCPECADSCNSSVEGAPEPGEPGDEA